MYPNQPGVQVNGVPQGIDPQVLAALQAQWAQQAQYPPGHPSAAYQYPQYPQEAPPAATPSAAAQLGAVPPNYDQLAAGVAAPGQALADKPSSPASRVPAVLGLALVFAAAAGTAVAVSKVLDRVFGALDARGQEDQADGPHEHG